MQFKPQNNITHYFLNVMFTQTCVTIYWSYKRGSKHSLCLVFKVKCTFLKNNDFKKRLQKKEIVQNENYKLEHIWRSSNSFKDPRVASEWWSNLNSNHKSWGYLLFHPLLRPGNQQLDIGRKSIINYQNYQNKTIGRPTSSIVALLLSPQGKGCAGGYGIYSLILVGLNL